MALIEFTENHSISIPALAYNIDKWIQEAEKEYAKYIEKYAIKYNWNLNRSILHFSYVYGVSFKEYKAKFELQDSCVKCQSQIPWYAKPLKGKIEKIVREKVKELTKETAI